MECTTIFISIKITAMNGQLNKLNTMKKLSTIQKICSNWHNGQWSALYQFTSSGIYLPENHLRYLKEIQECLEPEYNLHPSTINKKYSSDLTCCIDFFTNEGNKHLLFTEWARHDIYGYKIPYLTGNPRKIQITPLTLFI